MEQERGDDASAAELTRRAVQCAARGGDLELEAWALVRAAEFALYRGDARSTVGFARRAGKSRSTAVRAGAALREAQGYALAGATMLCEAALERARALQESLAESRYMPPPIGLGCAPDPSPARRRHRSFLSNPTSLQ
ncbi:hypothetical protein FXN61_04160, partial [Lentzea sp. PSKA42]|nr:hypothetical protein [Lentzea indica]